MIVIWAAESWYSGRIERSGISCFVSRTIAMAVARSTPESTTRRRRGRRRVAESGVLGRGVVLGGTVAVVGAMTTGPGVDVEAA